MPGRKGARIAREEGLEKTNNNLSTHSWVDVQPINQKNYYTEFLKREDQALVTRLQNDESRNKLAKVARDRDRALANGQTGDVDMEGDDTVMGDDDDDNDDSEQSGAKTIIIHPGSQNLRIGLASEVLPKTVPFCIARRSTQNNAEAAGEPSPKRRKVDPDLARGTEKLFGEEFATLSKTMATEVKDRIRRKGLRIIPNSREVAISFNRKTPPEIISEHNDTTQVDWTEIPAKDPPAYLTSNEALRIPDESTPRYRLYWPLKYGMFNEEDYDNKDQVLRDFTLIIEEAIRNQLGIKQKKDWPMYQCVFVVPDLYERYYITTVLDLLLREFGFTRVCFIQESLAGSFGAGTYSCVIVDVGAQKTSISCVDEGMCVESSRINLRYGGADVTDAFVRLMLMDQFPYQDINLNRRFDFLIGEELKRKACMMSVKDIGIQQHEFDVRQFGHQTQHYTFKAYDEPIIASMCLYFPELLDNENKVHSRRKLIPRSYDIYDGTPNDPTSSAQTQVLSESKVMGEAPREIDHAATRVKIAEAQAFAQKIAEDLADPSVPGSKKEDEDGPKPLGTNGPAGSPEQDETSTPQPKARDTSPGVDAGDASVLKAPARDDKDDPIRLLEIEADMRDRTLPVMPLARAIQLSIEHAARGDERKTRDFYGGIITVGGGCQMPGFNAFLEDELSLVTPRFGGDMQVVAPPRDIDPQVLIWKGASIFGKLRGTNDSWIGALEYDRLGSRVLAYKAIWGY